MATLLPKKSKKISSSDYNTTDLDGMPVSVGAAASSSCSADVKTTAAKPAVIQSTKEQVIGLPICNNQTKELENVVENTNANWINNRWRPAMGWMYMTVCIFDFMVFPILWSVVQFWETQPVNDAFRQWAPLTLQSGGLFHVAMGVVLGITSYGRSKEKIEGRM